MESAMLPKLSKKELADRIESLCVLVVDDNQYLRKTIRNLRVFESQVGSLLLIG